MSEAIKTVRQTYKSIVHVMKQTKDTDIIVNSLYTNMSSYKLVYLTHLLSDIFGFVAILSKSLQCRGLSYTMVQKSVAIFLFLSRLEATYLTDT